MKCLASIISAVVGVTLVACGGGTETSPTASPDDSPAVIDLAHKQVPSRITGQYSFDGRVKQQVTFDDRDGTAFFEGDIVLGRTKDLVSPTDDREHALGIYVSGGGRWPNGVLTYETSGAPPSQFASIGTATRHIAYHSRYVRFSRDEGYASMFRDQYNIVHVVPTTDPNLGGSSNVGMFMGGQQLALNPLLSPTDGATAHEFIHALGAWHEQSRADRDSFVQINSQNIMAGYEGNFTQHISNGVDHGAYDYCSLMHYGGYSFSSNGGATIVPLQTFSCQVTTLREEQAVISYIGQSLGASSGDMAMLDYLYSGAPVDRPIAYAGDDQNYPYTCNKVITVTLDGSASRAGNGAVITKYEWKPKDWYMSPTSGPNPVINNTAAVAQVKLATTLCSSTPYRDPPPPVVQKYILKVTDNFGRVMSDVATITFKR